MKTATFILWVMAAGAAVLAVDAAFELQFVAASPGATIMHRAAARLYFGLAALVACLAVGLLGVMAALTRLRRQNDGLLDALRGGAAVAPADAAPEAGSAPPRAPFWEPQR